MELAVIGGLVLLVIVGWQLQKRAEMKALDEKIKQASTKRREDELAREAAENIASKALKAKQQAKERAEELERKKYWEELYNTSSEDDAKEAVKPEADSKKKRKKKPLTKKQEEIRAKNAEYLRVQAEEAAKEKAEKEAKLESIRAQNAEYLRRKPERDAEARRKQDEESRKTQEQNRKRYEEAQQKARDDNRRRNEESRARSSRSTHQNSAEPAYTITLDSFICGGSAIDEATLLKINKFMAKRLKSTTKTTLFIDLAIIYAGQVTQFWDVALTPESKRALARTIRSI